MATAFQSTFANLSLTNRDIMGVRGGSSHVHPYPIVASLSSINDCRYKNLSSSHLCCLHSLNQSTHLIPRKHAVMVTCAAVGTEEVETEPTTNVKFSKSIHAPGSSSPLQLLGTGFREKNIAFIKVKVYAIGMYVDASISTFLSAWKGKSIDELTKDASFLKAAAEAPVDKGIRIFLVRDVDGATFWEALNEALAPRLKALNGGADQDALKSFGDLFRGRSLKQGSSIYLTWVQPFKLEVAISGDSSVPETSEGSIDSAALVLSLFDVYLGENSVCPSAKTSVLSGLQALL